MRLWCSLAGLFLIGACALSGCAKSRGPNAGSSETHFLLRCSDDACGDGLKCICGTCSKACSSDTSCADLSSAATCVASEQDNCTEGLTCDVECKVNADCAHLSDDHRCEQGRCRAPELKTGSAPTGKPSDPALAYGPCGPENKQCGAGSGASRDLDGACLCEVLCAKDADCPKPATGTSVPICRQSDDRHVDSRECTLPCDAGERCPDGFACIGGSCWVPSDSSCAEGCVDSGVTGPADCQLSSIAMLLSQGPPLDCGNFGIGGGGKQSATAIACVRNAVDAGQAFTLFWALQGTDSELLEGVVGVAGQDGLNVYALGYDSAGVDPDGATSYWSQCSTFSVRTGCSAIGGRASDSDGCFQCAVPQVDDCHCVEATKASGTPSVMCSGAPRADTTGTGGTGATDPPPCEKDSCVIDGVCYPNGVTSEDGCCTCDNGMGNCIEPGWCPGWVTIGKRCDTDTDCSRTGSTDSGLVCRKDFTGERGLCTRDCGYGCQTGTECVTGVPDYNGGTIDNVCMRPCTAQADCETESHGVELGSTCETRHGMFAGSYCF